MAMPGTFRTAQGMATKPELRLNSGLDNPLGEAGATPKSNTSTQSASNAGGVERGALRAFVVCFIVRSPVVRVR